MRITHQLVALALIFNGLLASTASAQVAYAGHGTDGTKPVAWWTFFGTNVSYLELGTDVSGERDKNGFQIDLQLMASYYARRWAYNLGAGWYYNKVNTKGNVATTASIRLRAGFTEASAGYRLTESIWIGPTLLLSFGADLSYAPSISNGSIALLGGAKFAYEIPLSQKWRMRAVARLLTDVTISNRQLYTIAAGVEIGMPISFKPWVPEPEPDLLITLDEENFYFETASARLKPSSRKFVEGLGEWLAQHPKLWSSLRIEGHTDRRGEFYYNINLSKKRAGSVRKGLITGGVPADKVESEGYGPTRPIDPANNESAWRKNRRVEMKFYGVADPVPINRAIQELRLKSLK